MVVKVGICAMEKKSGSKPMQEILTRLNKFKHLETEVFPEEIILNGRIEDWPECQAFLSFFSDGFPLDKAIEYVKLRKPFVINELEEQKWLWDRSITYKKLKEIGVPVPRYAILDHNAPNNIVDEQDDQLVINGETFNKPFVEKPISAEDHNVYIYYPRSAGGGHQKLFRKTENKSSQYYPESKVRTDCTYIYQEFMPTDGKDIKVYSVGPDYAHAESRKAPGLDGNVQRTTGGKERRSAVNLTSEEKVMTERIVHTFKQTVCGFDLLRASYSSYVIDINGFSFVKNSSNYYNDCAKILGNMILKKVGNFPPEMSLQFDKPLVHTTTGKDMELRCVVAVIRHGDRTPKQKMKAEVKHPLFYDLFKKMNGYKNNHIKLKKPKDLQKVMDIATRIIDEIDTGNSIDYITDRNKFKKIQFVLGRYGFSGYNRKVQFKYMPSKTNKNENILLLILKWGGELTPLGVSQAENLGSSFREMYPKQREQLIGGHDTSSKYEFPDLGLLRLHSTFYNDLKFYASDEGRVQMTAAAFARGFLELDGPLAPILVHMVKSADTTGLLDIDGGSGTMEIQTQVKTRLHRLLQSDQKFTDEDKAILNPCKLESLNDAIESVENPVVTCKLVYNLIEELNKALLHLKEEHQVENILYDHESWKLILLRWSKLEKDFLSKTGNFDISKIPDIYDCIKYDLQHNKKAFTLVSVLDIARKLYKHSQDLANLVMPLEYGMSKEEKLEIAEATCKTLTEKIRWDLQRTVRCHSKEETKQILNRLNPCKHEQDSNTKYPENHVVTRAYFTSESHIHSLFNIFRLGGMFKDENKHGKRTLEIMSKVTELNYLTQFIIMLYEDPLKDGKSDDRFHVELHFSQGIKPLPKHSEDEHVSPNQVAGEEEHLEVQKLEILHNRLSLKEVDDCLNNIGNVKGHIKFK